jgi:ubiquinone/menaquinone biosynthesis C-methylase UbiE
VLHLPVADEECDAAYMVEALEHALVPRRAIEELCRSVRPGGEILIIDKCRSRQSLSRHEPWERWFTPDEVCQWLAPHCEEIAVRPIPHGHHEQPTGLFLCWTARKRGSRVLRKAA